MHFCFNLAGNMNIPHVIKVICVRWSCHACTTLSPRDDLCACWNRSFNIYNIWVSCHNLCWHRFGVRKKFSVIQKNPPSIVNIGCKVYYANSSIMFPLDPRPQTNPCKWVAWCRLKRHWPDEPYDVVLTRFSLFVSCLMKSQRGIRNHMRTTCSICWGIHICIILFVNPISWGGRFRT